MQAAKLVSVVSCWLLCRLLPNSRKFHCGHMLLCIFFKLLKEIYQALAALDNDIWLPLTPKRLFPFHSPMKRNFTLAEKKQRNKAADCDLFSRVLSDLLFIHSSDNGLLWREEYKMIWRVIYNTGNRFLVQLGQGSEHIHYSIFSVLELLSTKSLRCHLPERLLSLSKRERVF